MIRFADDFVVLDPWVDPPPGADEARIGRWRLVRYKLQDDSELLDAVDEHPEVEDLPQELKLVVGSVLGQDPKSVQALGCERVLELVGDAGLTGWRNAPSGRCASCLP